MPQKAGPRCRLSSCLLASLLQAFYGIRSERLLLEQLHDNLLVRWFVGLSPAAVAIAEPLLTALMAVRTEHGGDLQLDQLLQAVACQFRDQLPGTAAIE